MEFMADMVAGMVPRRSIMFREYKISHHTINVAAKMLYSG